jgi:hypothetical protein
MTIFRQHFILKTYNIKEKVTDKYGVERRMVRQKSVLLYRKTNVTIR